MAKNNDTLLIIGGLALAYFILKPKTTALPIVAPLPGTIPVPVATNPISSIANSISNLLSSFTPAPATIAPIAAPAPNIPIVSAQQPIFNPPVNLSPIDPNLNITPTLPVIVAPMPVTATAYVPIDNSNDELYDEYMNKDFDGINYSDLQLA